MNIVKEMTERFSCGTYYVEKDNVMVRIYVCGVKIIDLTNAMKSGKECSEWNWECHQSHSGVIVLWEMCRDNGGFTELIRKLRNGENVISNYRFYTARGKGVRTFSPFAKVSKQDTAKLTPAKLPKAILNGQIKSIVCTGHYTDDYAYDYAYNYGKGKVKDLMEIAKELTESTSGWWGQYNDNKHFHLSCHSFLSYEVEIV